MATGDIPTRTNQLDNVQSILNIFRGTPATTQTTSSSEQVSNDKAKAYLQQLLESTSGLAAVSSGQKAAGMYGSTVNQQLTNDLLARTTAATAALSTNRTSTTSTKQAPQLDIGKTLLSLGINSLASPILKAGAKKLGLNNLGDNIANSLFGDSTSASDMASSLASSGSAVPADIVAVNPTMPAFDTSTLSSLTDFTSAGSMADLGAGTMSAAEVAAIEGTSTIATDASVAADAVGTFSALDTTAAAGTALDTGAIAGGAAIGAAGEVAASADVAAGAGAAAEGAAAVEGASAAEGAAAAAGTAEAAGATAEGAGLLDTLATVGEAIVSWIICTELNKQNRLPNRWYIYGAKEFLAYDEQGKQGYYIWAIPSVKHLRKYPNSTYSRLMEVVFNARAEYLSAKAGCKGARKTALGFITTHGLYGFCWVLSRTIARKSYSKESILNIGA